MSSNTVSWYEEVHAETPSSPKYSWEAEDEGLNAKIVGGSAFGRIHKDRRICRGKSVVRGTRVPVFLVKDLHDLGLTVESIQQRYPHLSRSDIFAALAYAEANVGLVAREREDLVGRFPRTRAPSA